METIVTDCGIVEFEPVKFELGQKIIDPIISKENLLLFKRILDSNNVNFGLMYGTLLGAIRENGFIKHDEDTDVYILEKERKAFLNVLPELISNGFAVGRYDGDLLSVIKDGEYIDIYVFRRGPLHYLRCNKEIVPAKYLKENTKYYVFGEYFYIPLKYEELLEYLYGKNWKIPQKGNHAETFDFTTSLKIFIKKRFPKQYEKLKITLNGK